jgi:hypothetical protein
MRLSFIFHQISALIGIIATVYLFYLIFMGKLSSDKIVSLLFLLATAWAIQGILHFAEEYIYDFYPLEGKTDITTTPVDRSKFLGLF